MLKMFKVLLKMKRIFSKKTLFILFVLAILLIIIYPPIKKSVSIYLEENEMKGYESVISEIANPYGHQFYTYQEALDSDIGYTIMPEWVRSIGKLTNENCSGFSNYQIEYATIDSKIHFVDYEKRIGRNIVYLKYIIKHDQLTKYYNEINRLYPKQYTPYINLILDSDTNEIMEAAIVLEDGVDKHIWVMETPSDELISDVLDIYDNNLKII